MKLSLVAVVALGSLSACSESTGICTGEEDCEPGYVCMDGLCIPEDAVEDDDGAGDTPAAYDTSHENDQESMDIRQDPMEGTGRDTDDVIDAVPDAADLDAAEMDPGCSHPAVVEDCSEGGWCRIPAGCFIMGSPVDEGYRDTDEQQHEVRLTHDFEIQATEATQEQFESVLGYHPGGFAACGGNCPAEHLTWYEALLFCNALSANAGLDQCFDCTGTPPDVVCTLKPGLALPQDCRGYRLPTEAEWEYAVRAGTTTAIYSGDLVLPEDWHPDPNLDLIGWFFANSAVSYSPCTDMSWKEGGPTCAGTHPVGQKQANGWGMFDMSGNVFEWVWDIYDDYHGDAIDPAGPASGPYRVIRGGSWFG